MSIIIDSHMHAGVSHLQPNTRQAGVQCVQRHMHERLSVPRGGPTGRYWHLYPSLSFCGLSYLIISAHICAPMYRNVITSARIFIWLYNIAIYRNVLLKVTCCHSLHISTRPECECESRAESSKHHQAPDSEVFQSGVVPQQEGPVTAGPTWKPSTFSRIRW